MDKIQQPQTLEECLTLQSHFVGIPKITKKSSKEFYRRGKTLQVLGVGFLDKGRMPTIEEVEAHVDLTTNAMQLDTKKWNNVLVGILNDMTTKLVDMEKEGVVPLPDAVLTEKDGKDDRNPDSDTG